MVRTLAPGAREPLEELFAEILLSLMVGMIKSDSVEAEFAQIQESARKLTKKQMQKIAALAGKYYADHVPNILTKEKVSSLKKRALEFALKHVDNAS
jgi:hypothetical protein